MAFKAPRKPQDGLGRFRALWVALNRHLPIMDYPRAVASTLQTTGRNRATAALASCYWAIVESKIGRFRLSSRFITVIIGGYGTNTRPREGLKITISSNISGLTQLNCNKIMGNIHQSALEIGYISKAWSCFGLIKYQSFSRGCPLK